jgi:hypothetical protein
VVHVGNDGNISYAFVSLCFRHRFHTFRLR